MQKQKAIIAAHGWIHSANACFFAAVGDRLRTCSALIVRWLGSRFYLFFPSVLCSSLYAAGRMSTWSCQTWTRVHERARGGWKKKKGFLSVISRSGTVSCTLVWASSRIGARGRTKSQSYYLDIFQKPLNYITIGLLPYAEVSEWFKFN